MPTELVFHKRGTIRLIWPPFSRTQFFLARGKGGQSPQIRRQRSEIRGQRSEIRGQKTENRRRRAESIGRRSEFRVQRLDAVLKRRCDGSQSRPSRLTCPDQPSPLEVKWRGHLPLCGRPSRSAGSFASSSSFCRATNSFIRQNDKLIHSVFLPPFVL